MFRRFWSTKWVYGNHRLVLIPLIWFLVNKTLLIGCGTRGSRWYHFRRSMHLFAAPKLLENTAQWDEYFCRCALTTAWALPHNATWPPAALVPTLLMSPGSGAGIFGRRCLPSWLIRPPLALFLLSFPWGVSVCRDENQRTARRCFPHVVRKCWPEVILSGGGRLDKRACRDMFVTVSIDAVIYWPKNFQHFLSFLVLSLKFRLLAK